MNASGPGALEQEGPQRVRLRALEEGAAEPLRQRRDRRLAARDVRAQLAALGREGRRLLLALLRRGPSLHVLKCANLENL